MKDDKELTDLEVAVEIAKLKGISCRADYRCVRVIPGHANGGNCLSSHTHIFNPITDSALNLELRDEYEVEIDYFNKRCTMSNDNANITSYVKFTDKSQINRAAMLCILESLSNGT